jgi:hypothetical protein
MNAFAGERPPTSLFAKVISRPRRHWITAGLGLFLVLAPIGAAYLDGLLPVFFSQGYWRISLLPPAVIVYILAVAPIVERQEARVIEAFRPLVRTDDASFNRLVNEASRLNPALELLAFSLGGAFGLWIGYRWLSGGEAFWLRPYLSLSAGLMFGLLGWTIYGALGATRLTSELHRQPLRTDIFDTKPFEPIGRQSLVIALVFVGGIAVSVIFGLGPADLLAWENWILYGFLMLVPILVFFLNMRDTHRVLAAEKKRELEGIEGRIVLASRTLMERMAAEVSMGTLASEINALAAYQERVKEARTWPYDTGMLRTLLFSVIIPASAGLAQFLFEILFR